MRRNFIGQQEVYRLAAKNPEAFLAGSSQYFKFRCRP